MEGRLPETVLKGGAGSGVLRLRLVTAGSGGPGHRPPGIMTWLRGARCTDPEAMPEMEARPPAENRHGGAPRGERPASWDAPRLTRADHVASRKRDNRDSAPVGAPPTPLLGLLGGWTRSRGQNPGAAYASRERRSTLFDIVNGTTANGSLRAPRFRTCRARAHSRVPGERALASEDPGPRGDTTDRLNDAALRNSCAGSRLSFRSASPLCTRPGHETRRKQPAAPYALRFSGTLPPLSASLVMTCRCSQTFISAEPSSAPV